jgi:hypothetical protein
MSAIKFKIAYFSKMNVYKNQKLLQNFKNFVNSRRNFFLTQNDHNRWINFILCYYRNR